MSKHDVSPMATPETMRKAKEVNSKLKHNHPNGCKYLGNDAWDCGHIDNE